MSMNNLQDGSSSCSTTCHGDLKTMNRNANLTPTSFLFMREGFPPRRWSFVGPGSEKKWCSTYNERPRGEWERGAELMMIKFRESQHPVFRAMSVLCPEERSNAEEVKNYQYISSVTGVENFSHNYFR